jgi:hypothetical protein
VVFSHPPVGHAVNLSRDPLGDCTAAAIMAFGTSLPPGVPNKILGRFEVTGGEIPPRRQHAFAAFLHSAMMKESILFCLQPFTSGLLQACP